MTTKQLRIDADHLAMRTKDSDTKKLAKIVAETLKHQENLEIMIAKIGKQLEGR